jgi:type II secretory pathway component PulF
MKLDEFAFVNRQLAGMLKSGIPLEGAIRQLSANLERGALREELQRLEKDLANGVPLVDALPKRKLPEFYKRMVGIGATANNLPGMLLNMADYYSRRNALWSRLKGLLVYPLIVLTLASAVSLFVALAYGEFINDLGAAFNQSLPWSVNQEPAEAARSFVLLWFPTFALLSALAGALIVTLNRSAREAMRWRCPGFREASLSQVAGTLAMMLKGGCSLGDSLALMSDVEGGNRAGAQLKAWGQRVKAGHQGLDEVFSAGLPFPPLFIWLASSAGEDAATGLERAKEVYHERAIRRSDMLLLAALPAAIVGLGFLILAQATPLVSNIVHMMDVW